MGFVEDELAAVDPGAEAEVGGQEGEEPRDDARDDGADVGAVAAARFAARRVARRARRRGFRHRRPVAAGHRVGDGFACGERARRRGLRGRRHRRPAAARAPDDGLHGPGYLVAVAAAEAGGARRLRRLLVLRVAAGEGGELILPF